MAASKPNGAGDEDFKVELVSLASLKPHPRNYVTHPADEVDHIAQSISEHGLYKNVVVAEDSTILAGHGVVQAMRQMGRETVPVRRLPLHADDPRALKLLAGDNEIAHLREVDDRALSDLLREVKQEDLAGLLGTGYDEAMLANLVFVTRTEEEVGDMVQAGHWAGMPEYQQEGGRSLGLTLTLHFEDAATKQRFIEQVGLRAGSKTISTWWPPRVDDDTASVRFDPAADG